MTRRIVMGAVVMALAASGLWAGSAAAVTCSVTGNAWNPDPAVANSSQCGAGDAVAIPANDPNNPGTPITLNGTTFTLWDKDESPTLLNGTDNGFFITGTTKSGFWYWDATDSLADGNDVFALVLKDGNVSGVNTKWAWFILDNPAGPESGWLANPLTAGGCQSASGAPAAGTYTQCGTWSMYGQNGNLKNLSFVALYGADTLPELPTLPPASVPEPGTLLLLSLGLAGAGVASKFRKAAR